MSQSVKEVLQSLVDDNLVDSDKIGTSIYFWAFPSKAAAGRKRRLEELEQKVDDSKRRLVAAEEKITEARKGREDTEERKTVSIFVNSLPSISASRTSL